MEYFSGISYNCNFEIKAKNNSTNTFFLFFFLTVNCVHLQHIESRNKLSNFRANIYQKLGFYFSQKPITIQSFKKMKANI